MREKAALVGVFAFCVGSSLYSYLLYRSRLVPRWLSGWGIGAAVLLFLACLLALFSQRDVTTYTILALPVGVQEMVLAVWLIVKGFDPADRSVEGPRGRSLRPVGVTGSMHPTRDQWSAIEHVSPRSTRKE